MTEAEQLVDSTAKAICGATGLCVCARDTRSPSDSTGARCLDAIDEAHAALAVAVAAAARVAEECRPSNGPRIADEIRRALLPQDGAPTAVGPPD